MSKTDEARGQSRGGRSVRQEAGEKGGDEGVWPGSGEGGREDEEEVIVMTSENGVSGEN